MDYRTLELTIVSAKGPRKAFLIGNSNVYAVAYISGTANTQKLRTPVHKDGGSNPVWNFPMKFTFEERAGLQNRLTLVVKIKAVGLFVDKDVGEVRVPIKDLRQGEGHNFVSYQVNKPSGKPKGYLTVGYRCGERFSGEVEEAIIAHHTGFGVGSGSAPKKGNTYRKVNQRSKKYTNGSDSGVHILRGALSRLFLADAHGGGHHGGGGGCGGGGGHHGGGGGCGGGGGHHGGGGGCGGGGGHHGGGGGCGGGGCDGGGGCGGGGGGGSGCRGGG